MNHFSFTCILKNFRDSQIQFSGNPPPLSRYYVRDSRLLTLTQRAVKGERITLNQLQSTRVQRVSVTKSKSDYKNVPFVSSSLQEHHPTILELFHFHFNPYCFSPKIITPSTTTKTLHSCYPQFCISIIQILKILLPSPSYIILSQFYL